jgi:hypothetical protein
VRVVTAADLAARGSWIDNWHRMLPLLVATRDLLPQHLLDCVQRRVREQTPLSLIPHELSTGDPSLVRGAVFELLCTGRLRAPALRCQPLSLHTMLEPAR